MVFEEEKVVRYSLGCDQGRFLGALRVCERKAYKAVKLLCKAGHQDSALWHELNDLAERFDSINSRIDQSFCVKDVLSEAEIDAQEVVTVMKSYLHHRKLSGELHDLGFNQITKRDLMRLLPRRINSLKSINPILDELLACGYLLSMDDEARNSVIITIDPSIGREERVEQGAKADPWEKLIFDYVEREYNESGRVHFTASDILTNACNRQLNLRMDSLRLSPVMGNLGMKKSRPLGTVTYSRPGHFLDLSKN